MFVKTITVLSALVAVNAAACKRPSASSSVKLNSTLSSNSTATATNVELGYAAAATSGAVSQNASSVWGEPSASAIATSTSVIASSTWSQAPATSSASSSGSGDYSGTATYYAAGLGACGWTNSGSDYIVAMNQAQYSGDTCGKNIQITDPSTGRTATAQIADLCPSCAYGDLDMSTGLFSYLHNGNMDAGIFEMTWSYV